jgi:hypothetical protein
MFLYILLVLIFLALVRVCQNLAVACQNDITMEARESKRHSEIVLLLRGIKAVGIEEVEGNKRFTEALEAHTDALARFGSNIYDHQMSMEHLAEAMEDN